MPFDKISYYTATVGGQKVTVAIRSLAEAIETDDGSNVQIALDNLKAAIQQTQQDLATFLTGAPDTNGKIDRLSEVLLVIQGLLDDVDALKADTSVSTLQTLVGQLQSTISSINTQMGNLENRVDDLENAQNTPAPTPTPAPNCCDEVDAIKADIQTIIYDLTTLTDYVGELSDRIGAVSGKDQSVYDYLDNLNNVVATHGQALTVLQNKVNNIESTLVGSGSLQTCVGIPDYDNPSILGTPHVAVPFVVKEFKAPIAGEVIWIISLAQASTITILVDDVAVFFSAAYGTITASFFVDAGSRVKVTASGKVTSTTEDIPIYPLMCSTVGPSPGGDPSTEPPTDVPTDAPADSSGICYSDTCRYEIDWDDPRTFQMLNDSFSYVAPTTATTAECDGILVMKPILRPFSTLQVFINGVPTHYYKNPDTLVPEMEQEIRVRLSEGDVVDIVIQGDVTNETQMVPLYPIVCILDEVPCPPPPTQAPGGLDGCSCDEIFARIESVESSINSLSGTVSTIQGTISTLQGTVTSLGGTVSSLNTKVTGFQTTLAGYDSTISGLQTSIGTINTTLGGLQATVNSYGTKITNIESSITTINGTVSGLSSSIGGIQTTISSLQASVDSLGSAADMANCVPIKRGVVTTTDGISENTVISLPAGMSYSTTSHNLLVNHEGFELILNQQYQEVDSTHIKMLMDVCMGDTLEFFVIGECQN